MAIAELVVKLIGDISGFQKTMSQAATSMKKIGKDLSSTGASFTKGLTLPMAAIGGASLMMAGEFQSSMSKVSALGEITGADLKKLEQQAIELGSKTQFSAKQAADGMGEFAAAGFNATEIGKAMSGTLDLAAAAQIDVGQAAQITASTLGQFGMQADQATRVADTLAKGSALGTVSITDLAESLKYVGPVAKTVGHTLEETTASLALLSNAGIKGSEAGTALRMGLIRMVKPTKDAQGVIDKYGLSLADSAGKVRPMIEVIKELESKQVSLADLTRLVGVNAVSAWQALKNKGSEALSGFTDQVNKSKGAAETMAATLRDNLKGSYEQMGGAVETLGISLGMILTPAAKALMGVVQSLAEKGTQLTEWFRGLNQNTQNAIVAFGVVVGVIGPVVLVIGKLAIGISILMKTLAAATGVVAIFTSATGIGLIAIALGLAVAAVVYFKDDIYAAFIAVKNYVEKFVEDFNRGLDVIATAWSILQYTIDVVIDEIKTYIAGWVDYFWQQLVKLGEYLSSFVNEQFLAEFKEGFRILTQWTSDFVRDFKAGWEVVKQSIGLVSKEAVAAQAPVGQLGDSFRKSNVDIANFLHGANSVSESLKKVGAETEKTTKEVKKNTDAKDKNAKGTEKLTEAEKAALKLQKEKEKADEKKQKQAEAYAKELDRLVRSSSQYRDVLAKVKDGSISAADGNQKLADIYNEANEALKKYNQAQADYDKFLADHASSGNIPVDQLNEYIKKLEEAENALGKFQDKQSKAGEGTDWQKNMEGLAKDIEGQLANALGNAFTTLMKGGSLRKQAGQLGASIGGAIGAAVGSYFGPVGTAVGGAAGSMIGEQYGDAVAGIGKTTSDTREGLKKGIWAIPIAAVIYLALDWAIGDKVFKGDSEGTQIRKALDGFFAKTFESKRILAVIDGQMQVIRDFDFGGGTFGTEGGAAGQYFKGMESSAQSAFQGIATGFTTMLGLGTESAQGLAAVLAQSLGGSLNNLQVMISGMGLSIDQMREAVVSAALDGKLTFEQATASLQALANVAEKGIPDGIGLTVKAFENLKDAGVRGGRYSTDALRDLADEAKEIGVKTIPQLMQNLLTSGKFTQQEIEQVFKALKDHGIDSIEALSSATDEQLIGVLGELQSMKFPFDEASDDIERFADKLNEIPPEKDLTINIKTNLDSNTRDAMGAGIIPNAPGGSQPITRNAKGNVLIAGGIKPHAKGGVVDRYSTFNMASMAERGPEAIMPLERLPDGRLGVLSADSNPGGGGSTNITINAPYAMPGLPETVVREIDKYMDKKNRPPGIRR